MSRRPSREQRRRPTAAGVIAFLALCVSLATAAWALPNNSVLSEDIVTSAVRSSELAPKSVSTDEIQPGGVRGADVRTDSVLGQDVAADAVNGRVVSGVDNVDIAGSLPTGRAWTFQSSAGADVDDGFCCVPNVPPGDPVAEVTVPAGDYVVIGEVVTRYVGDDEDAPLVSCRPYAGDLTYDPANLGSSVNLSKADDDDGRSLMRIPVLGAFDLDAGPDVTFSIRCSGTDNADTEYSHRRLTAIAVEDVK